MNKLLLYVSIIFLVIGFSKSALAQSGEYDVSFYTQSGYDGYVKQNTWTPITIRAVNRGPDVNGEVRIRTKYPGETYSRSLNLPSQSEKEITIYALLRGSEYTVEFVSDEGDILYRNEQNPRIVSPYGLMMGVVSADPSLLNFLAGLQAVNSGENAQVAHLSIDELPDRTAGLSSFDVLIFNDIDTGQLSPNQRQAIKNWVKLGGRLVVGGGPNGAVTTSGLAELLPAESFDVETLPTLVDLADYAGKPIPDQGPYLAAIPQNIDGTVLLTEQGRPFLLNAPLGRGSVSYFALDFGLAPMNGWAGNEVFWRQVLDPLESTPIYYATYNGPRAINDALANITVAGLPSPAVLVMFLCIYIIMLVPANYFVLRRMKRMELAWITIPALILFFSVAGYIGGFRARGGQAILKQISVIWQNSGDTKASVDSFIGLYSPARERYTLRFEDDMLVQPTESGNGYKGVKTTSSAPTTIQYGGQTELQNLWTDVGGMSTLLAHTQADVKPIEVNVGISADGGGWRVSGVVTNNSGQDLEDAILLIGNYGVQLSNLKRGQSVIDHPLQQLNIQPYSDQTLWGEYYYQINDPQVQVADQIVRNIIWPEGGGPTYQAQTPTPTFSPSGQVYLIGWQNNASPPTRVDVVGRNVDLDSSNLIIVTGQAGGF